MAAKFLTASAKELSSTNSPPGGMLEVYKTLSLFVLNFLGCKIMGVSEELNMFSIEYVLPHITGKADN